MHYVVKLVSILPIEYDGHVYTLPEDNWEDRIKTDSSHIHKYFHSPVAGKVQGSSIVQIVLIKG